MIGTEELRLAVNAINQSGGNKAEAARMLGVPVSTLKDRLARAARMGAEVETEPDYAPFERDPLPEESISAEELIDRRKKQWERKRAFKEATKLIPIRVKIPGPIAICHFGDPHVDDDGTDIGQIERHIAIVNGTEGMFGASVGDYNNNWVGRLARLYGEQGTSAREAWTLVEWFIRSVPWLYLVGGNHDAWSGAGDPLRWMEKHKSTVMQGGGVRLALQFQNGREVRISARHQFKGHSQWNTAHGVGKAAKMRFHDHILVAGHTHVSGYQIVKQEDGLLSHCFQVGSYKRFDKYAEENDFPDNHISPAVVTIIDPFAERETSLVTFHWDVEEAAEVLAWKRKRHAESHS